LELVVRLRPELPELEDAGRLVHSRIARWGPVEKNHIPLKRKQRFDKKKSKGFLPKELGSWVTHQKFQSSRDKG
jgi:hypothetical protein